MYLNSSVGCFHLCTAGHKALYNRTAFIFHHCGNCKFRPCLIEVCGTAAKVRLQPEHVRFVIIGIIRILCIRDSRCRNLVCHLKVLMRPHIRRRRCRHGVERLTLQQIAPERIAADGKQGFAGIHHFRNAAALAALDRRITGQALVTGKMSGRHAVVFHQLLIHGKSELIRIFLCQTGHQCTALKCHGGIYHMVCLRPVFLRSRLLEIKIGIKLFVIDTICIQQLHQLQKPGLRSALIHPQNRDQALVPARCRPVKQRISSNMRKKLL